MYSVQTHKHKYVYIYTRGRGALPYATYILTPRYLTTNPILPQIDAWQLEPVGLFIKQVVAMHVPPTEGSIPGPLGVSSPLTCPVFLFQFLS